MRPSNVEEIQETQHKIPIDRAVTPTDCSYPVLKQYLENCNEYCLIQFASFCLKIIFPNIICIKSLMKKNINSQFVVRILQKSVSLVAGYDQPAVVTAPLSIDMRIFFERE